MEKLFKELFPKHYPAWCFRTYMCFSFNRVQLWLTCVGLMWVYNSVCTWVCLLLFFPTFELTNEASERVEEEDVSTVKWLSGYVNAGRRQEHSEDISLRELEKNMRHCSKSISIDPLRQRHDLPIATQCQRHSTTHPHHHRRRHHPPLK